MPIDFQPPNFGPSSQPASISSAEACMSVFGQGRFAGGQAIRLGECASLICKDLPLPQVEA